ncbi:hypothetical protein ACQJBY_055363 [Aegilops geniculata]
MVIVLYRHEAQTIKTTCLVLCCARFLVGNSSCGPLMFCSVCSGPSTSAQRRPVSEALQNSKGKEMQNEPPRTMDALFAQMKQQRMRIMPPQQPKAPTHVHQFNQQRRGQQQRRGRGGYGVRSGGGNR